MESLNTASKSQVVSKYRVHDTDTGSPEVQIALLTQRIEGLGSHFAAHVKDLHSRHGMMQLINRRKKLLQYLKTNNIESYKKTIASLGLRK
ncbi:MAG: 30S ribosomal protein S15 [bacterium]|nr:30S ribosomal protein S15 [bacterium]